MKKRFKYPLLVLIILLLVGLIKYFMPNKFQEITNKESVTQAIKFNYSDLKVQNKASILMNLDTNQIIYQKNMKKATPVYSVSKVMFLATVSKKMKEDNISFDKKVRVTPLIDNVNKQGNFSNAGLKSGNDYTIRELFEGVMMPSGNDAAILLAFDIFGSHEAAVLAMKNNAKEWGMKNSSFVSTSGLDGKYLKKVGINAEEGKNLMSPYDNVLVVKKIMSDYPEVVKAGTKTETIIGGTPGSKSLKLENVNEVVFGLSYGYPGVYGLKTGSNIEAYSNCIIALKKNHYKQNIVAISFSSKDRQSLYGDVTALYDYLKTLDVTNVQNDLSLNTKVGFTKTKVDFTLVKPYYLYVPKNQQFEYKLTNLSSKYNKQMNRFYNVNESDYLAKLEIVNQSEFFDETPLNISNVQLKNRPEFKNIFGSAAEFITDLIKK